MLDSYDKNNFFNGKSRELEDIQIEFNDRILKKLDSIEEFSSREIDRLKPIIDKELSYLLEEEIWSNIREFQLNIATIIVNFQRITALKIIGQEDGTTRKKYGFMQRIKLFFLMEKNTSQVYGKKLVYLQEELKKIILNLELELDKLFNKEVTERDILELSREYFRLNSDMNVLIDDINNAIDSIYGGIAGNRDKNINLSFLLISAFLSLVLFFPEFNNMINLQDDQVILEEKLDQAIYEKFLNEISLGELIELKTLSGDSSKELSLDDQVIRDIVIKSMEKENERLLREKNRINIFIKILSLILIPFLVWILFISI